MWERGHPRGDEATHSSLEPRGNVASSARGIAETESQSFALSTVKATALGATTIEAESSTYSFYSSGQSHRLGQNKRQSLNRAFLRGLNAR